MAKIFQYSKAIAALLGAIATFLVAVGAPAEWSAYASSVVAILTGIATFGIPNKTPGTVHDVADSNDAVEAVEDILHAKDAVDKQLSAVRDAVSIGTGVIQVGTQIAGSLAEQVIKSIKFPKL